jgi:hypothetical protein
MRFEPITLRPVRWVVSLHPRPAYPPVDCGGRGRRRESTEKIVAALPDLEPADVAEALRYAAATLHEQPVALLDPA